MVIYIKELDKNDKLGKIENFPKVIKKAIIKIISLSNNFFSIDIDDERKKYILPNINNKKVYFKILKKLRNTQIHTKRKIQIVLDKNLKKYKQNFKSYSIIDGRRIINDNIVKVIEKITRNLPIETQEIHILTNSYSQSNVRFVQNISLKVRETNIITKQIEKYNTLEEILIEEGIGITISNNKRKSLKNAKIIINLDFSVEDLKKYNIFRNACIINLCYGTIIENLQGFDGIVIQKIEVEIPKEEYELLKNNNLVDRYDNIELYESIKSNSDDINVIGLYGNNGKIDKKELLNLEKILTNTKK